MCNRVVCKAIGRDNLFLDPLRSTENNDNKVVTVCSMEKLKHNFPSMTLSPPELD